MDKDYIKEIEGAERRFYQYQVTVEKRNEGDNDNPAVIEGYAALVNEVTDLGWYREEILPGAFDTVLTDDVRCLFNHDRNLILARSVDGEGTLELTVDEKGLKYKYTTPNRSYALDLADAIEKGDVTQSSFAFIARKVIWTDGGDDEKDLRQIVEIETLFDVAPVTYAAYADTSVAKRSKTKVEKPEKREIELDEFEARYLYNKNQESK